MEESPVSKGEHLSGESTTGKQVPRLVRGRQATTQKGSGQWISGRSFKQAGSEDTPQITQDYRYTNKFTG